MTNKRIAIEAELEKALPPMANADWTAQVFGSLPDAVAGGAFAPLIDPCRDLVSRGGKRWRPLLLVLAASLAPDSGDALESAYKLAPLVELAHTASLIHDDIEDSSDTRRGAPAAHLVWGVDTALNAASWLYFQAASCIRGAGLSPAVENRLYSLYLEELRRLHLGQAKDSAWHKNHTILPSVEEYLAMTRLKTGTLASLAMKAGMTAAGADPALVDRGGQIAADVGAAFQILDDVINLTTGNPGKKRGDDIVEGKKSLPVLLYAARQSGDFSQAAAYFEQAKREGPGSPAVEACIVLLEKSDAIGQAEKIARDIIGQACLDVKALCPQQPEAAEPVLRLFEQLGSPPKS
jgi:octaprenyl-diphosphate synthase